MAAHQAPPSLGFSRQEHWSGLPFPSPMQESEKWKWSLSVVSYLYQPHGLQPTRLLLPWDFPGRSTGVGCHCLLCYNILDDEKGQAQSLTHQRLAKNSSQHYYSTLTLSMEPPLTTLWYITDVTQIKLLSILILVTSILKWRDYSL